MNATSTSIRRRQRDTEALLSWVKQISQIGSFPQVGVKKQKMKPPPRNQCEITETLPDCKTAQTCSIEYWEFKN